MLYLNVKLAVFYQTAVKVEYLYVQTDRQTTCTYLLYLTNPSLVRSSSLLALRYSHSLPTIYPPLKQYYSLFLPPSQREPNQRAGGGTTYETKQYWTASGDGFHPLSYLTSYFNSQNLFYCVCLLVCLYVQLLVLFYNMPPSVISS